MVPMIQDINDGPLLVKLEGQDLFDPSNCKSLEGQGLFDLSNRNRSSAHVIHFQD